ncbi:hypothetical protein BTR23_15300 [Alkalihalophilus pseudofirmus]|nr:hypothetical protein BTR23_15300 [Alkalihalophilus pseudofirmus]
MVVLFILLVIVGATYC